MSFVKTKDFVPAPYVTESRDFQLFIHILDLVQNSIKYDIDNIPSILDTQMMPAQYLDCLKSKLGYFTDNIYDDRTLRIVLSSFPHIVKYKGSPEGIFRCVYTFLQVLGYTGQCRVEIYNSSPTYDHTVRIGILKFNMNVTALEDMLRYVLPTGYLLEIYTYESANSEVINSAFDSRVRVFNTTEDAKYIFNVVRSDDIKDTSNNALVLESDTFNTAYLSTIMEVEEYIDE